VSNPHVGESLTGATALALKALGLGPAIEAQNYPVKHGANFYGPGGKNEFWVPLVRCDTLSTPAGVSSKPFL